MGGTVPKGLVSPGTEIGKAHLERVWGRVVGNRTSCSLALCRRLLRRLAADLRVEFSEERFALVAARLFNDGQAGGCADIVTFEAFLDFFLAATACGAVGGGDGVALTQSLQGVRTLLEELLDGTGPAVESLTRSQGVRCTGGGPVSVTAFPQRETLYSGRGSTELTLLLQVRAAALQAAPPAPPLALCVVLDRSGSMSGTKLRNAKRAIRKVVKHLRPGLDCLHFCTFGSHARAVFECADLGNKEQLVQAVRDVAVGGSTNLAAGLRLGWDLVKKTEHPPGANRVIFFFSDGRDDRGEKAREDVWRLCRGCVEEGVLVSAFGIGDGYDEVLMKGVAEHGRGTFAFMESGKDVPKFVSKAIHGLMSVAATNVRLAVVPVDNPADPVSIRTTVLPPGPPTNLPDLISDNMKQITVDFRVDMPGKCKVDQVDVLAYSLTYTLPHTGEEHTLSGTLTLRLTTNSSEVDPSKDSKQVLVARAIKDAARTDALLVEMVGDGRLEDAIGMKKSVVESLARLEQHDDTGHVTSLLKKARETLAAMQAKKKNMSAVKKKIQYDCYMEECDDSLEYNSGCDSDADAWSASLSGDDVSACGSLSDDDDDIDDDDCGSGSGSF